MVRIVREAAGGGRPDRPAPAWLDDLNPEQREVVLHGQGPLLVLAGAGSGKTRALTCRIAHLVAVRGVAPEQILALTFTNRAAREMAERVEALCRTSAGPGRGAGVFAGTFHSFGARFLRRHAPRAGRRQGFVIYDDDDQLRLIKRLMAAQGVSERAATPRELRRLVERARRSGRGAAGVSGAPPRFDALLADYEAALRAADAFDFGDLVRAPAEILAADADLRERVRAERPWVLVDEYQDTDATQAALLEQLAGPDANLMVVGDDDQAIYGWRGAEVDNILRFADARPGTRIVKLERNYRSTAPILAAADAVIARNRRRLGKRLVPTLGGGEPVGRREFADGRDEARRVVATIAAAVSARDSPPGAHAIFYRTNAQSRPFEDALRAAGLPYEVVGGVRFYDRAEIRDVLAYARVATNRRDGVACLRILNVPARGIGKATADRAVAASAQAGPDACVWDGLVAVAEGRTGASGRAAAAVARFTALIGDMAAAAADKGPTEALAHLALETGYAAMLEDGGADPENRERRRNLDELLAAARDHERGRAEAGEAPATLATFLQEVALHTDLDGPSAGAGAGGGPDGAGPRAGGGRVTLMTLHAAKGLEFDDVHLTGLEEGLFPLERGGAPGARAEADIEEERRLAYVGITRARRRLTLTWARTRVLHGQVRVCTPSRFLRDVPAGAADRRVVAVEAVEASLADRPRGARRPPASPAFEEHELVDYEPDYDAGGADALDVGARVVHAAFGDGEVVERVSGRGPDARVAVRFPARGVKRIVARYLTRRTD